jgi:hypothetical protein
VHHTAGEVTKITSGRRTILRILSEVIYGFALDVIAEGQLATLIPVIPSAGNQAIEGIKRCA